MKTFHQLYLDILKQETGKGRILEEEYDPYHMDCLLNPGKHAPIIFTESCEQCAYERACENSCIFDAFERDENGKTVINPDKCIGCGACVDAFWGSLARRSPWAGCARPLKPWDLRGW